MKSDSTTLQEMAAALDRVLNGERKGADRINGFVLLTFPFEGEVQRVNYISNAERGEVVEALKGIIERFETNETRH